MSDAVAVHERAAIALVDYQNLDIGCEIDVVVGRDPLICPKPEPDGVLEVCRRLVVASLLL